MVFVQDQRRLSSYCVAEPLPHPSNCQHEIAIATQVEFCRLWANRPPVPEPLLCRGDRSQAVIKLKRLLNHQRNLLVACENTADNKFDALTQVAVMRFQHQHGLFDDGTVGPVTWRQLRCPQVKVRLAIQLNSYRPKEAPYQKVALRWLQAQLSEVVLNEFKLRWEHLPTSKLC